MRREHLFLCFLLGALELLQPVVVFVGETAAIGAARDPHLDVRRDLDAHFVLVHD